MKTPQIEIVENFLKRTGSVSPSHLSLVVDGHRMSYESFCRHLRTLHRKGKLEQRKIEKGRVAYDYISKEPITYTEEPDSLQLKFC